MTIITIKIADIKQATPTIRILKIDLMGQEFKYKAGQWIDCYAEIDGKRRLVGYSLASSPTDTDFIELAVKISDNPVSEYVHSSAKVGDFLYIEGGQGDIFYDSELADKVVLIGAGIGVAPLMGILRFIEDGTDATVSLFQSASSFEELVYYDEALKRAENPRITYYPTVSRGKAPKGVAQGRITGRLLDEQGVDYGSLFYLSGPGEMIPELESHLLSRGVSGDRIKYEVWWKSHTDT